MQDGRGSPERAEEDSTGDGPCDACAVAESGAAAGDGPWLTDAEVAVESDVFVLSGPLISGRVVVPHEHIGGLEELSTLRRGQVLAAIRRAAAVVGEADPRSPARVVVSTASPASPSHVSFHVLPPDHQDL